jgi:hypothetical protein
MISKQLLSIICCFVHFIYSLIVEFITLDKIKDDEISVNNVDSAFFGEYVVFVSRNVVFELDLSEGVDVDKEDVLIVLLGSNIVVGGIDVFQGFEEEMGIVEGSELEEFIKVVLFIAVVTTVVGIVVFIEVVTIVVRIVVFIAVLTIVVGIVVGIVVFIAVITTVVGIVVFIEVVTTVVGIIVFIEVVTIVVGIVVCIAVVIIVVGIVVFIAVVTIVVCIAVVIIVVGIVVRSKGLIWHIFSSPLKV